MSLPTTILEEPKASWQKRYQQRHFGYRDFASVTTVAYSETQALGVALLALAANSPTGGAYYQFGTNAKAKTNPATGLGYGTVNWPALCYARDLLFLCNQNAWVSLISLNPAYLRDYVVHTQTKEAITASQLIYEEELYVPASNYIRINPTLGYGLIFRADTLAGTLRVWIEGNVEGDD